MTIVTLTLTSLPVIEKGIYEWEIYINGLTNSQRMSMASSNPEIQLEEHTTGTGELRITGPHTPGLRRYDQGVPVAEATTYLNILADLDYNIVSSFNEAPSNMNDGCRLIVWTLRSFEYLPKY